MDEQNRYGHMALVLVRVFSGTPSKASEVIDSLTALGSPLTNTVGTMTWPQANSMLDAAAPTASE
jgi:hypothetical protein